MNEFEKNNLHYLQQIDLTLKQLTEEIRKLNRHLTSARQPPANTPARRTVNSPSGSGEVGL